MRRGLSPLLLQYIHGVKARPYDSTGDLLEEYRLSTSKMAANVPTSQRYYFENDEVLSQRHKAIQLRIGGAQMLSSTKSRIYNHDAAHPLFFSQTSPRDAGLCATLVDSLWKLRIKTLTELQGALIPLLLKGKHVFAHAETGTGKSFGIALATANRIIRDNINHKLHTVIIVPTEELALQYDKWLKHFGGCASQVVQPAVESIPLETQLAKLHNIQPQVLVGTVQRIAEINKAAPTIIGEKLRRRVDCIVLDEADLVLNQHITLGRQHLTGADLVDRLYRSQKEEVPAQMVATSATIDGATAQKLNAWMKNEKAVRLTTSFVEHTIPDSIDFYFFPSSVPTRTDSGRYPMQKCLELILRLILRQRARSQRLPRILLFTGENSDHVASLVSAMETQLAREWHSAQGEGNMSDKLPVELVGTMQLQYDPSNPNMHIKSKQLVGRNKEIFVRNDSSLARLNEGRLMIGVCDFELSRGMHVGGVTHVIMYGEVPPSSQFVHCAGRTGRMGNEGEVILIFPPSQGKQLQSVCNAFEIPFKMSKMSFVEEMLSLESFGTDAEDLKRANKLQASQYWTDVATREAAEEAAARVQAEKERLLEEQKADVYTDTIRNAYVRESIMDAMLWSATAEGDAEGQQDGAALMEAMLFPGGSS